MTTHTTSTEGCDFWLTYMLNAGSLDTDNTLELKVVIATDLANSIVVENPNSSFRRSLEMAAHSADTVVIASTECYMMESGVVQRRGIHLTSRYPVTVYAASYGSASMDATFVLPTQALGKEYMVQSFPYDRQAAEVAVVATQSNTQVSLSVPGDESEQTIVLQRGETYLLRRTDPNFDVDLSGTVVCADKPVAVFAGNQAARVPHSEALSDDHIYEQAVPTSAWGTRFLVPMVLRQQANFLHVTALNDHTEVRYGGVLAATLQRGETWMYEMQSATDSVALVETTYPVACYLYLSSALYNAPSAGDPAMMLLPPLDHRIPYQTFTTFSDVGLTDYLSVVVPTAAAPSLLLDGAVLPTQPIAELPGWSLYRDSIASGVHTMTADDGFVSWVYGMSDTRSYGYAAGFSAVAHEDSILLNHHRVSSLTACPNDTVWMTALLDGTADVRWEMTDSLTQQTIRLTGEDVFAVFPELNANWRVCMIATRYTEICQWPYEDTVYARVEVPYASLDDPHFYDHGVLHICDTDRVAIDTLGLVPLTIDSTYLFETRLTGVAGCDSVVRRRVWVHRCSEDTSLVAGCDTLRLTLTVPDICADDEWMVLGVETESARPLSTRMLFSDSAKEAGFRDTTGTTVAVPYYVRPNRYRLTLMVTDTCGSVYRFRDLPFTVLYPSWVVDQHWNDVLAILSDDYNGGYHFTDVRWYRNGELLPEARQMHVYLPHAVYTESEDTIDVYYQAELTRSDDGYVGMTCPMYPQPVEDSVSVGEPFVSVSPTLVTTSQPSVSVLTHTRGTYFIYNTAGKLIETARYQPCEHGVFSIAMPVVQTMYLIRFVPDEAHPNNPEPVVKVLVQ